MSLLTNETLIQETGLRKQVSATQKITCYLFVGLFRSRTFIYFVPYNVRLMKYPVLSAAEQLVTLIVIRNLCCIQALPFLLWVPLHK